MAQHEAPHSAPMPTTSALDVSESSDRQLQSSSSYSAPPPAPSEFHRLFPQVPATENVVQDFQCSLSRKKLLRVGRLYVTPVRLCFSSMLVDPVELPWTEIASCEKKTQMLFDQIIVTPVDRTRFGGELCFTGFMNGAASPFSTVKMLWGVRKKYSRTAAATPAPGANSNGAALTAKADENSVTATEVPPASTAPQDTRTVRSATPPATIVPPLATEKVEQTPRASTPPVSAKPASPRLRANSNDTAQTGGSVPTHEASPPPQSEDGRRAADEALPGNGSFPGSEAAGDASISPREARAETQKPEQQQPATSGNGTDGKPPVAPSPSTSRRGSLSTQAPLSEPSSPVPQQKAAGVSDQQPQPQQARASEERSSATTPAQSPSTAAPPSPSLPTTAASPSSGKGHRRTRSDGVSAPDPSSLQQQSQTQSDFLRTFPNVPRTESILDSFQCSYVSGVHRLGKMHITGNYLLFHSVMLAEPIVVKLTDVARLEKSTSLLVLDGLSIVLHDGTRHEFTSFISREKAYGMLQQLVNTHDQMKKTLGSAVSAGARPASPARSKGDSPSPGIASPVARPATPSRPNGDDGVATDSIASEGNTNNNGAEATATAKGDGAATATATAQGTSEAEAPPAKDEGVKLQCATASSTEPPIEISDLNDFDAICPTDYGTGFSKPSLFMESPLTPETPLTPGYTVFDVFRWVYDEAAPVMAQYRAYRRDQDVEFEPWRPPVAGGRAVKRQAGQRCMRCQTIIRALLTEKYYPCEEFQRFAFVTLNGKRTLLTQQSTQASGVTFSDTFRTESLCVYTEGTDPATGLPRVTARQYVYIQFLKFSIVKGKIRSESTKELKDGMARLNELTSEQLRDAPSGAALKKAMSEKKLARGGAAAGAGPEAAQAVTATAGDAHARSVANDVAPAITRQPSTPGLRGSASGAFTASATAVAGGGQSIFVPPTGPPRIAVFTMLVVAALYALRAAWNVFWFYAAEPIPAAPAANAAAASGEPDLALQQLAAAQTLANFVVDVARPAAGALLWAGAAFFTTWALALLP